MYQQEGGLTGEYFVSCKMNGIETYTCPQQDMTNLIDENAISVKAYPNPTAGIVTVAIENSSRINHVLTVINEAGIILESISFEGDTATIDMSHFNAGRFIVSIDGYVVKIIRN